MMQFIKRLRHVLNRSFARTHKAVISGFKRLREIVNTFLYDSQSTVLASVTTITTIGALTAIGILIYYHGFEIPEEDKLFLLEIIKLIFGVFILKYFTRLFYAFNNIDYLKRNWLEGILVVGLLVDIISYYWFHFPIIESVADLFGMTDFRTFYIYVLQLLMVLLIMIEIGKLGNLLLNIKVKPGILFVLSFLLIILAGTGFLMLPEMTVQEGSMNVLDAFFTAVSATCVTGLIVVDTATFFTFKGHMVILVLMQLGGLGILSFATFFASFLKAGVGIQHQAALQEIFHEDSLYNTVKLLREIFLYTFVIELAGVFAIFSLWNPDIQFAGLGDKIFHSIFHAVSAFCNAGFDLLGNSLNSEQVRTSYVLHIIFAVLIVLGGLGFPVLKDLFGIKNLRKRMRQPWRQWKTSTKIAVYASFILIVGGALLFYLLEYDNSLSGKNPVVGAITAIFQSVTTRTAGFNTVDIGGLATPTYLLFIFLMFVGASSGSTGGGIKTSTFVVIMMSVVTTIKGKKQIEFGRKSISHELLYRAFSVVIFSSLFIFLASFLLTLTEPDKGVLAVFFEEVSAFGTVGLTTGVTGSLSWLGKIIVMVSMFVGRVGPLTLAFALSSPISSTDYKYPETNVMVG